MRLAEAGDAYIERPLGLDVRRNVGGICIGGGTFTRRALIACDEPPTVTVWGSPYCIEHGAISLAIAVTLALESARH